MRRWSSGAVAAAAALVVGVVGVASPAAAQIDRTAGSPPVVADQSARTAAPAVEVAEPTSHGRCNSTRTFSRSSGYLRLPVYVASGSWTTHCVMRQGDSNTGVAALQRALINCYGLSTGGVDGIFGPATYNALRTAQSREGITADGVYGPQTRSALWWPRFNSNGSFSGVCHKF